MNSEIECDEYPYASTIQGGFINYQQGKVSIRFVDAKQNKTQGKWLKSFYYNARVSRLDPSGSWFGVRVTERQNTHFIDRAGVVYRNFGNFSSF
jgi:hypothetical protein